MCGLVRKITKKTKRKEGFNDKMERNTAKGAEISSRIEESV